MHNNLHQVSSGVESRLLVEGLVALPSLDHDSLGPLSCSAPPALFWIKSWSSQRCLFMPCWTRQELLHDQLTSYVQIVSPVKPPSKPEPGPQELPISWFHTPNAAMVSYASKRPQHDIRNYFGLEYLDPKCKQNSSPKPLTRAQKAIIRCPSSR